jgi:hypothetical protein
MRWLCSLAIVVFLSGCAMPAAFTVASLALDTGSYAMSGKTLSDHGLSLAMEEDCSMMRVLDEGNEICQEEQDYEVADTILTPLPEDGIGIASRGDSWDGVGYVQLAQRVYKARTIDTHYVAAGMMESEI